MKNKTKTLSVNKKPAKIAKKKTPPLNNSLSSVKKKAKKTIKNKTVIKSPAILKKHAANSSGLIAEKYRDILDSIEEGFFEVDLLGNFTFFNDSVCRVTGYSRKELMGTNHRHYTHEENLKTVVQAFNKVYKTGKPLKGFGWHISRKDGLKRYVEGSVALLNNSSGRPTGFRGIVHDITERKRMEELISQNELKYRTILESFHEGYFEIDLKGNFTFCNDAMYRIVDYSKEELLGRNYRVFANEETARKLYQEFNEVYTTGEANKVFYWTFIRKDGTKIYVESSIILQKDSSGKPTGFRGIARDVSERKQMENKLKNSEEKFRMLAESSSFAIMMHQGDHWIYANRAAEEISGYTQEELCGMHFWDVVHPDYREMVKQSGYKRQQGKVVPLAYEFKIIAKNGMEKWVSLTGSPIQYEDKPTALISLEDITERKIAESKKEAAMEALQTSELRYLELSIIDDLTQLFNSRHFHAQLEKEIERSNRYHQPLTLLMLDLDKFKDFNDTYGHVQGDYVLSRLGHAIKRSLRETDSAYRYGGEEFTIILPMTVSDEGIVTAKRIQKELRKENFSLIAGQELYMTVSIGLAQYKLNEEIKTFVDRVDQFMYKVKKTDRGKICSDDGKLQ